MKNTSAARVFVQLLLLLCACAGISQAQDGNSALPVVKSAGMPLYPYLARTARIEGTVWVQVTTDGTAIVKMLASGAHKLLSDAAQENLKTWRFYPHKPQTFTVEFVYKLEPPEIYGPVNATITLKLPSYVEILSKMHTVETVTTDTPD
jgi:TonB family protein